MGSRTARQESTDSELVAACLDGDEEAWIALVDRYAELVHGIVRGYGADPEEAADLFQGVWLAVHNGLPQLRKHDAFEPWLVSVASRTGYHWRLQRERRDEHEIPLEPQLATRLPTIEPEVLERLERHQLIRQAIRELPPRCRKMIRLLFFTVPARPYAELASELGLATGSIGFIRGRCLGKLRRALEELGLR